MSKGLVKAVVGAVLALALAMTALLFNGYRSGRSVEFAAGAESADAPVQVLLLIREVDPVKDAGVRDARRRRGRFHDGLRGGDIE